MRLVADIGGTNARFACANDAGTLTRTQFLVVPEHETFTHALEIYLGSLPDPSLITSALFAAAGPRTARGVQLTNAAWEVTVDAATVLLPKARVGVLNDFEAVAWSLPYLLPSDLAPIVGGEGPVAGPMLAIGPGTGLGMAVHVPGTGAHPGVVIATEGGHVEAPWAARLIAPDDAEASAEDFLSGRGLLRIYKALGGAADTPEEATTEAIVGGQPARDAAAMFFDLLADTVRDAALTTGATGGVFIAGGIVPRLSGLIDPGRFRARFTASRLMRGYLERIPVALITHAAPGLLGLAHVPL